MSLVLAVSSTIILGLQQLNFCTGLAFSFVAVGTLVSAVEPFFNWRSRWILMEEAQYRLQRIRDELEYYLLKTPAAGVALDDLDPFFDGRSGYLLGHGDEKHTHRPPGSLTARSSALDSRDFI